MSERDRPVLKSGALRRELYDVLDQVEREGTQVIVERYSRPVAALIPIRDLGRLDRQRQAEQTAWKEKAMQVIVVTNLSGGEGKTTVVREVGAVLAARGLRVGLIDTDPQASLTRSLGLLDRDDEAVKTPAESLRQTVFYAVADEDQALPPPLHAFGMDVWPANKSLSKIDSMLYGSPEMLGNLRRAVRELEGYDYILIDTTPVRTALLLVAVAAADHVIVPVMGGKGLENLGEVMEVLDAVRDEAPNIGIRLFALNGYTKNVRHDQDTEEALRQMYGGVAATSQPVTFRKALFRDAASAAHMPVSVYQPKSPAVPELERLATEVVEAVRQSSAAGAR